MSTPVTVCVPTLRRYDCLFDLVDSLRASTIKPNVSIIDNGNNPQMLKPVLQLAEQSELRTDVFIPKMNLGVAASWNWFIQNIPEDRIITNDDVVFAPDSIQKMIDAKRDDVDIIYESNCGFSCYLLRDSCVKKVGLYDETISPGYGYYEDEDYMTRIRKEKAGALALDAGMFHKHTQTLEATPWNEIQDHHRKFALAKQNYINKWGGMPDVVKASFM